jgi:RNA polymerase sigma factor (sigma-70 family)
MDTGDLVRAAAAGDHRSWDALVDRFSGTLWAVARSYRLREPDAADVVQTTWLNLVQHLGNIREPDRVGAWLATTARRECLRTLGREQRQVLTDDEADLQAREPSPSTPEEDLLAAERQDLVRAALAELPPRYQQLLRVLSADPAPSYEEVGAALAMPVGSIGPTRARGLERLRHSVHLAGLVPPTRTLVP